MPKPQREDYDSVIDDLAARVGRLEKTAGAPRVTTIPPFADPDARIDYVAASAINWPLRYNADSLSPYKWESVGADPIVSGPAGSMGTNSTAFVALTGGPGIVVPRDGEYRIRGTIFMATTQAGVSGLQGGIAIDGIVQGINAWGQAYIVAQATFDGGVMPFELALVGIAAGATITMKVATSGGVMSQYAAATMNLIPVRVR